MDTMLIEITNQKAAGLLNELAELHKDFSQGKQRTCQNKVV